MKKILLTGSCGFIFSNFIRNVIKENYTFVSVDKLVAPYNHFNIYNHPNHKFYLGDIADVKFMDNLFKIEQPDIIIHGAAESFVDDSIKNAQLFISSNVIGTQVMVDMAIKYNAEKFIYISTDEVYGQLINVYESPWTEESSINPRNPYSASKAAGELVVKAANQTHGLKYNITRCCNNFGPRQPPRNLIPKIVTSIIKKETIPIHGNGKNIREWIYVDDHISAIMCVLTNGKQNEIYNIGSGYEMSNMDMVKTICEIMNDGHNLMLCVKDRPGHDFRYSVNCEKLKKIGWESSVEFNKGLVNCINWYVENQWYFK